MAKKDLTKKYHVPRQVLKKKKVFPKPQVGKIFNNWKVGDNKEVVVSFDSEYDEALDLDSHYGRKDLRSFLASKR